MHQLCRSFFVLMEVRKRFWIVFDSLMLAAFLALEEWTLTGVPLHEWLGIAFAAAAILHLLLHWSWVATQFRTRRLAYALNLVLFVSMAAAIISGFAISKVVLPLHPNPDAYLKWHSIHELSSNTALFVVGLHLALNADRLFVRRPMLRVSLIAMAIIIAAVGIVTTATWSTERAMPRPNLVLITPGRRIEHAAPPPDIASLRRGTTTPSARGLPKLFLESAVVLVVAVIGRKALRLRL